MSIRKQNLIVLIVCSLALGIASDLLIRQSIFGLNFLIWAYAWALVTMLIAIQRKVLRFPLVGYMLMVLANAAMVYVRSEPIVQAWSVLSCVVFLSLMLGQVGVTGFYTLPLIGKFSEWVIAATTSGFIVVHDALRSSVPASKKSKTTVGAGVIIAIPLVLIFIGLFASADEVFSRSFSWIGDLLETLAGWLEGFNIGRLILIGFWATLSLFWLGALIRSRKPASYGNIALGTILRRRDAAIILSSVTAVFGVFILIQLRYLFSGGQLPEGITFASYARRGYGELLFVTILASSVVYLTRAIVREKYKTREQYLSYGLVGLNLLVVLSAWKRLSLYESAYGWTMTRFVARMGLVCIVLGSVVLLVWLSGFISKTKAYAYVWYSLSFVLLGAAILNPIGLITTQNIRGLPKREVKLDVYHLLRQSPDSYPSICTHARYIMKSHPEEFKMLVTRTVPLSELPYEDSYYLQDIQIREKSNSGLSRHMVYSAKYQSRYSKCLRN